MKREISILFSTPMIQALLAGRKTQTRRIFKYGTHDVPQAVCEDGGGNWVAWAGKPIPAEYDIATFTKKAYPNGEGVKCPYGQTGDVLYVKESHFAYGQWEYDYVKSRESGKPSKKFVVIKEDDCYYTFDEKVTIERNGQKADFILPVEKGMETGAAHRGWYKRNSLFMPKEAARIWLEVLSIRVEKVSDISEVDAIDEGVMTLPDTWIFEHFPEYSKAYHAWEPERHGNQPPIGPLPSQRFKVLIESINGPDVWDKWTWVINFRVLSTTGRPSNL